jgi:hypothetical protein
MCSYLEEKPYHCISCEKCKAHYCITEQAYIHLSTGDKANRDFKEYYDSKYEPEIKKLKPRVRMPIIGA